MKNFDEKIEEISIDWIRHVKSYPFWALERTGASVGKESMAIVLQIYLTKVPSTQTATE